MLVHTERLVAPAAMARHVDSMTAGSVDDLNPRVLIEEMRFLVGILYNHASAAQWPTLSGAPLCGASGRSQG
jgi:hypothetical protein